MKEALQPSYLCLYGEEKMEYKTRTAYEIIFTP